MIDDREWEEFNKELELIKTAAFDLESLENFSRYVSLYGYQNDSPDFFFNFIGDIQQIGSKFDEMLERCQYEPLNASLDFFADLYYFMNSYWDFLEGCLQRTDKPPDMRD